MTWNISLVSDILAKNILALRRCISEVSSKIFEAVFDGLEGDTVWGTFQVGEEEAAIDEEEMEAQLIGVEL